MVGLGQSPREWNKPDFTARFCKDQTLTWGQPWSPNDKHFSILSLNERWRDRASRQTCESIFTSHKLRQDDRKISHSVVGVWKKQKRKQEEPTIQTKICARVHGDPNFSNKTAFWLISCYRVLFVAYFWAGWTCATMHNRVGPESPMILFIQ